MLTKHYTLRLPFKKIFSYFLISIISITFVSTNIIAHDPTSIELEYDFFNQKLDVTITHSVADPNNHYIETVDILKNDSGYLILNYTSQPTLSTFTYTYDVAAQDGDDLEVTAICSISGSITGSLIVDAPAQDEIVIETSPTPNTVNENAQVNFTISTSAAGQPLDGVSLEIDVKSGSASAQQRASAGEYTFTYIAPDVTRNLHEVIDITASKEGYKDGDLRLEFTVTEYQDTGGSCPPTLDGFINTEEYEFSASFDGGNFILHWKVVNDTILLAMEGRTDGWVAVGIEPSDKMKDADMIFGWVSDSGAASILDCFSTGTFGPHPPDTEIGGTSDILCYGGKESGGKTVIEFKRLLTTGDTKDQNIPASGEITIIWATGPNDDFESKHDNRGYGKLDTGTGDYSEIDIPEFWIFHASVMVMGFLFMTIGIAIAKVARKKDWWLKAHKAMGIYGAASTVVGLIVAFIIVSMSGEDHFKVPHAFIGISAIIFSVLTPILGFAQFMVEKGFKKVQAAHRWSGRITFTLILINILIGLSLVV